MIRSSAVALSGPRPLAVAWLGRVGYRATWELQESLRARILDGADAECLLLCEHDPVITLGKRTRPEHLLASEAELAARGVDQVASNRGGSATYHGPGQLVAYPVVRLGRSVVEHVEALGGAVCDTVAPLGIAARFEREPTWVWVGGRSHPRKLAAFGLHIRRRVAIHGLALNVTTPRSAFDPIVPCGLCAQVTSISDEKIDPPPLAELARALAEAIAKRLARAPRFIDSGAIAVRSQLLS